MNDAREVGWRMAMTPLSTRVSLEEWQQLKKLSKENKRPISYLSRIAIQMFLMEYSQEGEAA